MYGDLSQNTSTANLTRGAQIMNLEHRYLLQKYYNNETSYSISTVGTQTLTLTGSLSSGATSATLSAAWTYYTSPVLVTFSNTNQRVCRVEKGSTAISWDVPLTATATSSITVGGMQWYPLPPNYSKLKTVTITVGALRWTPREILTRQEWDDLNVFPYYADIPKNFFIYNGQIGIWPIPSTTGNTITFNYKYRVPDLSLADDTTGTVSVTNTSNAITGSGTSFIPTTNYQLESRWIQISPNKGDNLWYQIATVDTTTGITLFQPYQGITVSGGSFTIGQMPLIIEDCQDILVYKALIHYFSSIVDNPIKKAEFESIYNEKLKMLDDYSGTKTVNVNLRSQAQTMNPNLFGQTFG